MLKTAKLRHRVKFRWNWSNRSCMTNYELLRWLVETRSRDVGHNRTLHSWASDRATCTCHPCNMHMLHVQHVYVTRATCFHSVTHVARLFPKLQLTMKIGLIHQICDGYTGIMQECECTATTYNLVTNYLLLREILIKCCSTRGNS